MKKNKNGKKAKNKKLLNRRGIILIVVLAVLILLINIITASYSWFSPVSKSGIGMQFQQGNYIRSEDCSFKVYDCSSSPPSFATTYPELGNQFSVSKASNSNNPTVGLHYYRITVTNNDSANGSNFSIFIDSTIPAGTTIGMVAPTNSVHTYSSATTGGVFLARNAYVSPHDTTKTGAGTLDIDFFIRYTGSDNNGISIAKSAVKLMYN